MSVRVALLSLVAFLAQAQVIAAQETTSMPEVDCPATTIPASKSAFDSCGEKYMSLYSSCFPNTTADPDPKCICGFYAAVYKSCGSIICSGDAYKSALSLQESACAVIATTTSSGTKATDASGGPKETGSAQETGSGTGSGAGGAAAASATAKGAAVKARGGGVLAGVEAIAAGAVAVLAAGV